MKIQDASCSRDVLNNVDSAVAGKHIARKKNTKRVIIIAIVSIVVVAILIGYVSFKYKQERQFEEGLLETATSVTSEFGVADLAIVFTQDDGYGRRTVVFQSDAFANISNSDKMDVFRGFNELSGTYSWTLNCEDEGRVTIISDGIQYTAKINEYGASHYRYLYADGNEILKDVHTASSSWSSSSGRTKSCSGGSVGCRSGFHPCHEMSNGYCNQCCANS